MLQVPFCRLEWVRQKKLQPRGWKCSSSWATSGAWISPVEDRCGNPATAVQFQKFQRSRKSGQLCREFLKRLHKTAAETEWEVYRELRERNDNEWLAACGIC